MKPVAANADFLEAPGKRETADRRRKTVVDAVSKQAICGNSGRSDEIVRTGARQRG